MDYFWFAYVFVIGSVIGSFLNVCIFRIPEKESVVVNRSHCPQCGYPLKFIHMIPVISFLFLRGKCPSCKGRISRQYPLVEALTACLFLITVMRFGYTAQSLLLCIFHCVLIVVAGIDIHTMTIPDILHIWIGGIGIVHLLLNPSCLLSSLTGLVIVSLPMLLLALLCGGFGGGDIKLCAVCGFFLGLKGVLLGFLFACILADVYAIYLIAVKKVSKKSSICFGPFLAAGFIISSLFWDALITWYLTLLL